MLFGSYVYKTMRMRNEDQETSHATPKLMLFSDLPLSPDNPGRLTPPLHSMASVPFRWEERPGKAILFGGINENESAISKSLELPPRLLRFISSAGNSSSKVLKLMPSPDTVLDSPYTTNYRTNEAASFRLMADASPDDPEHKGRSFFRSSGRGRSISRRRSLSFSFSNPDRVTTSKAPIDKIKRGRSLVSLSQNHLWDKFCGGLKQLIMSWTKKQEKNGSDGA